MILLTESNFSTVHIDCEAIRSKKRRRIQQSISTEHLYNGTTAGAVSAAFSQNHNNSMLTTEELTDANTGMDCNDNFSAALISQRSTELVAPDFNCAAVFNNEIFRLQLSNLLNTHKAVVLFFYESDFAVNDISLISRHYERLQHLNSVPLAMSTDTEMVHAAFLRSSLTFSPPFPLVADTTRSVSRHFNVINPDSGLTQRSAFIIDRSRKVRFSFVLEDSRLSHSIDTICNILQSF
ncbi:thioredoxin-like protein [Mycotypha africana]|uniref:thioredoxin-like protein n=1 Tax=Mycotypha africana TaxID=64632 RepID=UPI002300BB21|nr:thioredoxin-like protein [Mycotypha africana]KAI8984208.1 thioredoxin-like protein [Mycotypha africana]